jgi:hypothetical protein
MSEENNNNNNNNDNNEILETIKNGFDKLNQSITSINKNDNNYNYPPPNYHTSHQNNNDGVMNAINDLKNTITEMIKPKEDEKKEDKKIEVPEIPPKEEKVPNKKEKSILDRIMRG